MAAPLFPVNAHLHDPYRTFKFQVLIDGKPVAGLRKMSPLKKTTEALGWCAADDLTHERRLQGSAKFEAITLEQGLTLDPVFEKWANLVNNIQEDKGMWHKNFRKDIVINIMSPQGVSVTSYKVYRAWVSEYQALPDFDVGAATNKVGIQTVKLEHEGWERDTSVAEPSGS